MMNQIIVPCVQNKKKITLTMSDMVKKKYIHYFKIQHKT